MREILAAGGVLWRRAVDPDGVEIAVIHRPKHNDWSLPKGKLEPGESLLDAAVREVREETGHHVTVGMELGTIRYRRADRRGRVRDKAVSYWGMEDAGGRFVPGGEVDDLRWLSPDEAERLLSYDLDRKVLRRFRSVSV